MLSKLKLDKTVIQNHKNQAQSPKWVLDKTTHKQKCWCDSIGPHRPNVDHTKVDVDLSAQGRAICTTTSERKGD